jgi:hypothetical protein
MRKKGRSRNASKGPLAGKKKNGRHAKRSRASENEITQLTSGSEKSSFDPKRSAVLYRDDVTPQEKPGTAKGRLAGDVQDLSTQELSDAESVEELAEEGQDLEGELIKGIEDAPEADQGQVITHKFPQRDVPKFKDRSRLQTKPWPRRTFLHNLMAASFFRSFKNCRSCSCRDFSSGARKIEDGCSVAIT